LLVCRLKQIATMMNRAGREAMTRTLLQRGIQQVLLVGLVGWAATHTGVRADLFKPLAEPEFWRDVRMDLVAKGEIPEAKWIFLEGLNTPRLEAAEYLAEPRRQNNTVVFRGMVLLRREGKDSPWQVREQPMRAACPARELQKRQADGSWTAYRGAREGAAERVQWICSLDNS
jgi:hypothetical protein